MFKSIKIAFKNLFRPPLLFLLLSLFNAEAILIMVVFTGKLNAVNTMICMWIGVAFFLFVTTMVSLLIWFKPRHSVEDLLRDLLNNLPSRECKKINL